MLKIFFYLYDVFWVFICLLILIIYFKKKGISFELIKKLILLWPIITFIQLATNNLIIYLIWENDRFLRHLLPPESNYLFDSIKKYNFTGYLTTIILAGLIVFLLIMLAKKSQEKYLKYSEAWLVFLGLLIVGWSNAIVFIFSIFIFNVLGYLILLIAKKVKPGEVIYLTPYILSAVIFTLLIGYKLSYYTKLY